MIAPSVSQAVALGYCTAGAYAGSFVRGPSLDAICNVGMDEPADEVFSWIWDVVPILDPWLTEIELTQSRQDARSEVLSWRMASVPEDLAAQTGAFLFDRDPGNVMATALAEQLGSSQLVPTMIRANAAARGLLFAVRGIRKKTAKNYFTFFEFAAALSRFGYDLAVVPERGVLVEAAHGVRLSNGVEVMGVDDIVAVLQDRTRELGYSWEGREGVRESARRVKRIAPNAPALKLIEAIRGSGLALAILKNGTAAIHTLDPNDPWGEFRRFSDPPERLSGLLKV
ncbi:hypothetical protein ABIC29_002123 [Agromyces sp. PvR057]